MNVLHVVTDTDRRGAQRFALDLHDWLDARGHDSRLVALAPGTTAERLDVVPLGPRRLSSTTLRRLRALLGEASVVVAHGSTTLVACVAAGAGVATPLVYRSIGEVHYWANTAAKRVRMRYLLGRPAAVVALWQAAAGVLEDDFGVARDRLAVIPRGTASERFPLVDEADRARARGRLGLGMTDPVLLSLGSLSPEKNLEAAIACAAGLDAWLLVAGDGPLRSRLEGVAAASGNDRVRFLGSVARPEEVIAAADVLLLPSLSEGLPGVAVEAGFSGVPTVATDVGGVRDVVLDGVTGRVVPAGDQAAFTAAVAEVLPSARELGLAARRHCLGGFDLSLVGSAWEDLLRRVERGTMGARVRSAPGSRGGGE